LLFFSVIMPTFVYPNILKDNLLMTLKLKLVIENVLTLISFKISLLFKGRTNRSVPVEVIHYLLKACKYNFFSSSI
jgi:hypothetical protein